MNLVPGTQRIVGDTDTALTTSVAGTAVRVFSIEVISGGTASTVILHNGVAIVAGDVYGQVDGIASKSVVINYAGGKTFPNGCFIQTDANTTYVTAIYTGEPS
jgi:hypothetical protein